ncbi:MAG: lytic transglycosylase domain-containing protein [Myxococcota bacterium]
MQRRALACLSSLLLGTLSCAVLPTTGPPMSLPPEPVAATAEAVAPTDPVREAVHQHLLRYQVRSGLSEAELSQLADTIVIEARRYELDPALVVAVMHVESRFHAFAVSPVDALGLMQLLPSTAEWLAPSVGVEWRGPQTLFDPTSNVKLGVAYLRQLIDRYDGNVRTALLAYNWGPGRIDGRLRRGVPLPVEYAQLVFDAYGSDDSSS